MDLSKITLSGVKSHQGTDSMCFTTKLKLSGKAFGSASNSGNGGCNSYWFSDKDLGNEFRADCLKWYKKKYSESTESNPEAMDFFIASLMDAMETKKIIKRLCRKKTLFRLNTDEEGSWRTIAVPFDTRVRTFIIEKYGETVEIANEQIA